VREVGFEPDIIIECTGDGQVVADSIRAVKAGGVVGLTGVGGGEEIDGLFGGDLATEAVLGNKVIVGCVNANKRHWYKASQALARADRSWLARLVTRREGPEHFARALEKEATDVKVVVQFSDVCD
jgi:threonine dehydrogenase-like Zn-dependent dehydrogenase